MVRLKTRYILFEILYPERETFPLTDSYQTRSKTIISLHQSSNPKVTPKLLVQLIRNSLQVNFGDYGSSMAVGLSIKYFSNKTSTGIIRVNRDNYRHVVGSLTFVSSINGENCIVNCINVSGSIKKCEDKSIEISKRLMSQVGKADPDSTLLMDRFNTNEIQLVTDNDEEREEV